MAIRKLKETRGVKIAKATAMVEAVVEAHKRLSTEVNAFIDVGAMSPDSKLFSAIWGAFNVLMAQFDKEDWIAWYIYENDYGKRGFEASAKAGRLPTPIKTYKDLAKLIVDSE